LRLGWLTDEHSLSTNIGRQIQKLLTNQPTLKT
jgi:hypothetical protein